MREYFSQKYRLYLLFLGIASLLCLVWVSVQFALREQAQQNAPHYLLKDCAGQVALYAADGTGPLAVYELYTRLLPEQDVLNLQQGIAVQDETDLQRRLEDFGI